MLLYICYVNSNNKTYNVYHFMKPYYYCNGYIIWFAKIVLIVLTILLLFT